MIVLDTNVVSELGSERCAERVTRWSDRIDPSEMWITSTTISELEFGVMRIPPGRRHNQISDGILQLLIDFPDRILDFDARAAIEFGQIMAHLRSRGRTVDRADVQIASSCLAWDAAIATRNTKDFEDIPGLEVVNPWDED